MKQIFSFFFITVFSLSVFSQETKDEVPIDVKEIAPDLYRMFVNERVSVLAYTGDESTLLIDAGYKSTAESVMREITTLSDKPLRYIINTHIHGDHTGGNLILGEAADVIAHQNVKDYLSTERKRGETIIPAFPAYALPNISFTESMKLDFHEEELQLKHLPGGHTSGDIVVYFPESKVVMAGDLLFADYFPYVDTGNGGNPLKYLENIDYILNNYPEDVTVVGGHGPVYNMKQYADYRKTLQKTIDIIRKNKEKGMTAEQMKEKRILKKWESYGKFFITEERWIDTIFPVI